MLVASPLGAVVAPRFREAFTPGALTIAVDAAQVRAALAEQLRFDVVLTDLVWNDAALERVFDGLDVLDAVERMGRHTPVVFAMQGHGMERDHLDEAAARPGVAGVVRKSAVDTLVPALRRAATGRRLDPVAVPTRVPVHRYFVASGRGQTAARLAGAIASGRASNHDTLAAAARCSRNTAMKVADKYLGPLIRERGEHPEDVPLTTQTVYRWCGEHAAYVISWCRRNGHGDVLRRG